MPITADETDPFRPLGVAIAVAEKIALLAPALVASVQLSDASAIALPGGVEQ